MGEISASQTIDIAASPDQVIGVLADYVDLGGNVVAPSFDWAFPGLGGRFAVGGYHVLRIDYADVMFGWDSVFADITDMVRSRRHLGAVRI